MRAGCAPSPHLVLPVLLALVVASYNFSSGLGLPKGGGVSGASELGERGTEVVWWGVGGGGDGSCSPKSWDRKLGFVGQTWSLAVLLIQVSTIQM